MRLPVALLVLALSSALGVLSAAPALAAPAPLPAPAVGLGDAAPLFTLPALNEDAALRAVARSSVAISDFTGVLPGFPARTVVVQFVKRAGSEGQLQAMERLHKRYGNRGLRLVAILVDTGDVASQSAWVEAQKLDFPVLRDVHGIVADRYGVRRYPLTVVVDADGYVAALGAPGEDLESSLEAVVTPLLAD